MASEEKFRVALKAVLLKFGIDELKEEQTTILNCLIERHDCMAVLPTGYGKSLPFQMLIPLRMELSQSDLHSSQDLDSMSTINKVEKIIVCCPLISLMKDQVSQLKEIYCAKVAFKGESSETDRMILNGDIDLIYASPETLIGDPTWRSALQAFEVSTIVVDEFHTIAIWGENEDGCSKTAFRKWFSYLGELRSLFPRASILALSATCTQKIRKRVRKILNLKEDVRYVSVSPNKPNIKLVAYKVNKVLEVAMCWIVDAVANLKIHFPKTLIYCNSFKDQSNLYTYLKRELQTGEMDHHIEMFHSETMEEQKTKILDALKNPNDVIRIVIASSALGMGVDIVDCHNVILYGAPHEMVEIIQEIGRVGRDGLPSLALFLYNQYHLLKVSKEVKTVYKTTTCRRLALIQPFLTTAQTEELEKETAIHSCCDICQNVCSCGDCNKMTLEKFLNLPDDIFVSSDSEDSLCEDFEELLTLTY